MKIIADTNIWYYLGQNEELFEKVKNEPIRPTFVNIYELSKSDNILNNEELSRAAIQRLFDYNSNVIYAPPFVHVAQLHNKFEFEPTQEVEIWLKFTEKFAEGHTIDSTRREDFKREIDKIREGLQSGADYFNQEAEKIRERIKDKKAHKQKNTLQETGGFINFIVETVTDKKYNLDNFDLNQIELLVRTLDHYFKTIETSKMKIRDNDWFDFAILAYVQPNDKYWTKDKKWIDFIKEAGCENYLFDVEIAR